MTAKRVLTVIQIITVCAAFLVGYEVGRATEIRERMRENNKQLELMKNELDTITIKNHSFNNQ